MSSQRVFSAQGDEGGAGDRAAEGNTSATADHGETTPMETEDVWPKQSGAPPNTIPEPSAVPGSEDPALQAEEDTAAPGVNPEAPDSMEGALQSASIVEEHRTVMR